MNKAELVDAVAERLAGNRRVARTAVQSFLDTVVDRVVAGESVSMSGFGVFEPSRRAARTARNPATGTAVALTETTVPRFRPGTRFRSIVAADGTAPLARAPRSRSNVATVRRETDTAEEPPDVWSQSESTGRQAEKAGKGRAARGEKDQNAAKGRKNKKAKKDGKSKDDKSKNDAKGRGSKKDAKGKGKGGGAKKDSKKNSKKNSRAKSPKK